MGTNDATGNADHVTGFVLRDSTISQDFRLTKVFAFKERYRFSIFGEVFNAFNIANLTGYSSTLDTKAARRRNRHTSSASRPNESIRRSVQADRGRSRSAHGLPSK